MHHRWYEGPEVTQRLSVMSVRMWKVGLFCASVSHEFAAMCVPELPFPVSLLNFAWRFLAGPFSSLQTLE